MSVNALTITTAGRKATAWRALVSVPNVFLGTRLELEVEFKFQRGCCNLSLLFTPRRQRAPEGLLSGYY